MIEFTVDSITLQCMQSHAFAFNLSFVVFLLLSHPPHLELDITFYQSFLYEQKHFVEKQCQIRDNYQSEIEYHEVTNQEANAIRYCKISEQDREIRKTQQEGVRKELLPVPRIPNERSSSHMVDSDTELKQGKEHHFLESVAAEQK